MTKQKGYQDFIQKLRVDLGDERVDDLIAEAERQGRSLFSLLGDAVIAHSQAIKEGKNSKPTPPVLPVVATA